MEVLILLFKCLMIFYFVFIYELLAKGYAISLWVMVVGSTNNSFIMLIVKSVYVCVSWAESGAL